MTGHLPHFFVVGAPRSGTTLVRSMLRGHPEIEIPGETNFLPRLIQLERFWWRRGRLDVALFQRLAFANGRLLLNGLRPDDVVQAFDRRPPRAPTEAITMLFSCMSHGEFRIGDKTPLYVEHVPLLARYFPSSRFIVVTRHPLDVAVSLCEQPWGPDSTILGAHWWAKSMGKLDTDALDGDRLSVCRLEDLVSNPEKKLTELCHFLGLEYATSTLNYQDQAAEVMEQNYYPNSHAGLSSSLSASSRWKSAMTPREAGQAWRLVAVQARKYGYAGPDNHSPRARGVRTRWGAHVARQQWRRLRTLKNFVVKQGR